MFLPHISETFVLTSSFSSMTDKRQFLTKPICFHHSEVWPPGSSWSKFLFLVCAGVVHSLSLKSTAPCFYTDQTRLWEQQEMPALGNCHLEVKTTFVL